MYAYIEGTVDEIGADRAIIDAGGVGYELLCSSATLRQLVQGKNARLITHFHLGQDIMALYGFWTVNERDMFRRLISVTRVGPKLALSVLSHLSVGDIAAAILTENAAAFDRVPGMGRKSAARVLLELKEKVGENELPGIMAAQPENGIAADIRTEAVAALVSLGYDGVSAGRAVAAVTACERVEDMITLALKEISKR